MLQHQIYWELWTKRSEIQDIQQQQQQNFNAVNVVVVDCGMACSTVMMVVVAVGMQ